MCEAQRPAVHARKHGKEPKCPRAVLGDALRPMLRLSDHIRSDRRLLSHLPTPAKEQGCGSPAKYHQLAHIRGLPRIPLALVSEFSVAKSLSSILSQIERLQKEATAIQTEVVARIRKDIEKYGLTAEQLFGNAAAAKRASAKVAAVKLAKSTKVAKAPKASKSPKPPKYADGTGNTWGGMGKRPEWLRTALAAGKSLEEFLIAAAAAGPKATARKRAPAKARTAATPKPARKAAAGRKRDKPAEAPAVS